MRHCPGAAQALPWRGVTHSLSLVRPRRWSAALRGVVSPKDLEIGDVALVTVVAAPHRAEAFAVCGNLVDAIKAEVPIWKHQHNTAGDDVWSGLT